MLRNKSVSVDRIHEKLLKDFAIEDHKLKSDVFTFTFIRHPFQRIVSNFNLFHDIFIHGGRQKKNTERNLQLNLSMTFFESEKEIEKITGGGHRCPRCETRNYNKGISERV